MRTRFITLLVLAFCGAATAATPPPPDPFAHSSAMEGLLPVHVDRDGGRILLTLPAAGGDGVSARYLYTTALRTGLGSASTFLDRGRTGETQVMAFRRIGKKIAIEFENPRFRAAGGWPC